MYLDHVTYTGPGIDDPETLGRLPRPLRGLLEQINGFIQFHGGLHVRGACSEPDWHSLGVAWKGEQSFAALYDAIDEEDIPFAEDCIGCQYLLRNDSVHYFEAETGDLEDLGKSFREFVEWVQADPVENLGMHPLLQLQKEGGNLQPGQLLSEYPFFFTKESANGVDLRAVPAMERRRFLADICRQLKDLPDGAKFNVEFTD